MSFIRKSLLVIASVLLLIIFLLTTSLFILSSSLEYDNIKPELVSIADDIIEEYGLRDTINKNLYYMEIYCENNSEFVFKSEEIDETFVIPCEIVREGSSAIINESVETFVKSFYYKEYDCEFLDCFEKQETPFFLFSETAKNYWRNKFYMGVIFSFLLIIALFFLILNKTNLPFLLGGLLIISSLPFLKIERIFSAMGDFFGLFSFLGGLLKFFFSQAYSISVTLIILGIVLILLGIFLKIFKTGFRISDFLNKFSSKKKSKDKLPKDSKK